MAERWKRTASPIRIGKSELTIQNVSIAISIEGDVYCRERTGKARGGLAPLDHPSSCSSVESQQSNYVPTPASSYRDRIIGTLGSAGTAGSRLSQIPFQPAATAPIASVSSRSPT